MKPTFFAKPTDFRRWLKTNHAKASELVVGFHRVGSAKASMRLPEAVEEALCFGWIDGRGQRLDETSYTVRFTPRRPRSFWSNVNIARVKKLIEEGRMQPAGLKAYQARTGERSGAYSFEQSEIAEFEPALLKHFKANKAAWAFHNKQPPGYRKTIQHWVVSAKREETRAKRMQRLIELAAKGQRVDLLSPFGKK